MDIALTTTESALVKRHVLAYFWLLGCATITLGGVTASLIVLVITLGGAA